MISQPTGKNNGEDFPFGVGAAVDQDGGVGKSGADSEPKKRKHVEDLVEHEKFISHQVQSRSLPPGEGEQWVVPHHNDAHPHGGGGAAGRLRGGSCQAPQPGPCPVSLFKSV